MRRVRQVSSVPDDIPEISSEELAQWLHNGEAVALDCREAVEAKYERRKRLVRSEYILH